jgi:sigma-B regulation protein RsbU (phosphoserine phosphatase)
MDPIMSIVQQGTRSAMCVPLAYKEEVLGIIYGDRISTTRRYLQEDVDFLAALAELVTIGLVNSRLLQLEKDAIFLQGEIAVARQIQNGLFPDNLQLSQHVMIAALNEPGREVSGDYYDVVAMSRGRVGLIVSDVSGKGVASSLLAANLQAAVRVLLPENEDLEDFCNRLNHLVFQNTDSSHFITAILAVIDVPNGRMTYISAGHQHPIMISAGNDVDSWAGRNHLPFGVMDEERYQADTVELRPGHAAFFYTDGLHEAMNEQDCQYGTERIIEILKQQAGAQPQDLLKAVRTDLKGYCGAAPLHDDITMLAARLL